MNGPGRAVVVDLWNVGQGDATSLRLPSGELVLIDVGPKNSSLSQWLRSSRPARIRDVILTHNDADHAGALPEIVAELLGRIGRILMLMDRDADDPRSTALFRSVREFQRQGQLRVGRLEREDRPRTLWRDSDLDLELRLRHPQFVDNAQSRSPNDASAILTLDQAGRILIAWPGDATLARTAEVVPAEPALLFGPHHGAPQDPKNAHFFARLEKLAPANCFVSVGTRNKGNKHPAPAYVARLSASGCRVGCSQMTRKCDVTRAKNGPHIMNTSGYFGLPCPARGVFCRGHMRLTVTAAGLTHGRYREEHRRRLDAENTRGRRLLCAAGLGRA